jgi:hypothetical protein
MLAGDAGSGALGSLGGNGMPACVPASNPLGTMNIVAHFWHFTVWLASSAGKRNNALQLGHVVAIDMATASTPR